MKEKIGEPRVICRSLIFKLRMVTANQLRYNEPNKMRPCEGYMTRSAMLVSTHDMKLVEEFFPRTIVIDEGVIVADGKTKDILADAKLLEVHGLEKP